MFVQLIAKGWLEKDGELLRETLWRAAPSVEEREESMVKRWAMVLVLSLFLAGCSSSGTDGQSGIEGRITIGPMCPVVRPGESCPDKPFSAEVSVRNGRDREVARFRSDEQGRFRVALKPGAYTLVPKPYGIQRAPETSATVTEGQFTTVDISYDSGIR